MEIKKFNEQYNDKPYYKELGYDKNILSYLAESYQLWCKAENLPQISADEQDINNLSKHEKDYIKAFIKLWDITDEFECKFSSEEYKLNNATKKYNL